MSLKIREHEFMELTRELLNSDQVRMMGRWRHHGPVTTLDHSLFVAYSSYRVARLLRLDAAAAARGGLLHDLYLYDSRDKTAHPGSQCFDHPRFAARNAESVTDLSPKAVSYTHLALAGDKGSDLATGGMATKLRAAKMVTAQGCDMVITNGEHPERLYDIAEGKAVGTRFLRRN